jgi:hypothetical protein
MLSVIAKLTEKQREEIWPLIKVKDENKVTQFLQHAIPNFEEFLFEVYATFEEEYLANFKNNS